MPLTVVNQIGDEPVSLDELKRYLKMDAEDTEEDDILLDLIRSARERAETYTRRGLVTAKRQFTTPFRNTSSLMAYTTFIEIPRPPFIKLSPDDSGNSVYYINDAGASVPLTAGQYSLDNSFEPIRLCTQAGYIGSRVSVTYESGYSTTLTSNGVFEVTGESDGQLTNINLTGMSTTNTDYFKLYWEVATDVNEVTRTVRLYKDVDKTAMVAHGSVDYPSGDSNSKTITLTADNDSGLGGSIDLVYTQDESDPNDIIISGIKTTSNVPAGLKNAVLMMAGFFYENRMPVEMPPGAKKLMDPYRVLTI